MTEKQDNLESFAKRVITRIKAGGQDTDALERLICRMLTNKKQPVIAAKLAEKLVEWRYGKAKESMEVSGNVQVKAILIPKEVRSE